MEIKKTGSYNYKDNFYLVIGTVILAIGIGYFLASNNLVTGGFSGVAIIIEYISGKIFDFQVPLWATNILLNVPLFFITVKSTGFNFLVRTIISVFLLSLFLFLIEFIPPLKSDMFLTAVYGGVLSGIGLGFVFRGFGTTGGTDLLAVIINKYIKHISVSKIIFYLDSLIILLGFFVFGYEKVMYAIISVYISTKCTEAVLEGLNFAKAVFVISDNSKEIAIEIMNELDRGVTGLKGSGMYTNDDKVVILTVVSVKEIVVLKEIVNKIDKNSFVIVADVREVLGEGFKSLD